MIEERLNTELGEIATAGLTRRRRVLESPCGRIATVDGKKVLNFARGMTGDRPRFQDTGEIEPKNPGWTMFAELRRATDEAWQKPLPAPTRVAKFCQSIYD